MASARKRPTRSDDLHEGIIIGRSIRRDVCGHLVRFGARRIQIERTYVVITGSGLSALDPHTIRFSTTAIRFPLVPYAYKIHVYMCMGISPSLVYVSDGTRGFLLLIIVWRRTRYGRKINVIPPFPPTAGRPTDITRTNTFVLVLLWMLFRLAAYARHSKTVGCDSKMVFLVIRVKFFNVYIIDGSNCSTYEHSK